MTYTLMMTPIHHRRQHLQSVFMSGSLDDCEREFETKLDALRTLAAAGICRFKIWDNPKRIGVSVFVLTKSGAFGGVEDYDIEVRPAVPTE